MLTAPRYAPLTISAIAYEVGFGDLSYFNRVFRRRFGASPSEVRAREAGQGFRSGLLTDGLRRGAGK